MSKKVIVHVDDDKDIIDAVAMVVAKTTYELVSMTSMEEFFSKVDEIQPDFVIFDVMVEESDSGLKAHDKFSQDHPDVPIILLTSLGREIAPHFEGRPVWIYEKPFDPHQLIKALKSKLG